MFRPRFLWTLGVGLCLLMPSTGRADLSVTGSGTSAGTGQALSASADFVIINNGSQLQITLTNTASTTMAMSDVLTNLEFNMPGVTLSVGTGTSATVASGSTLYNSGSAQASPNTDVSADWILGTAVTPAGPPVGPFGYGVSATSFVSGTTQGTFGSGGVYQTPNPIDGADFGLAAPGSQSTDGLATHFIITDSAVLVLNSSTTLTQTDLNNINSVTFTYGSEQEGVGAHVTATAVPEPSTLAIAGIGALGMIGYGLRRRKALGA
jgi:PEP-CTERM motif